MANMYSEWASLQTEIQNDPEVTSVLKNFPDAVGKEVARSVVKTLAQNLNLGASNSEPSNLKYDKDVQWTMEVLCYGLTLPLTEQETIKDCVGVYCEWLSALTTTPKVCVPYPVVDDPNPYAQTMLHHLYNVFVPRPDAVADQILSQAVMCHRVLRTVEVVATESKIMTRETWESLLKFLLAINDALLGPPTSAGGIGEQLCQRILSVLFELWLLACTKSFPSPPFWKTFREMCRNWRHHEGLVYQWHRVNVALTARLLKFMYGEDYPELHVAESDQNLIPDEMDNECVAQCWFRFLHMLSNPVDLSKPQVISNTPKFIQMVYESTPPMEPKDYPCIKALPFNFHKAMKGLSVLVDAFLGICHLEVTKEMEALAASTNVRHSANLSGHTGNTPPTRRRDRQGSGRGARGTSNVRPTVTSSSPPVVTLGPRAPLAPTRPKVNSILHLFGAWLVEAALAGVKVHGGQNVALTRSRTASFFETDPSRLQSTLDSMEEEAKTSKNAYEAGRAEACGALCRIFCSPKTGEKILSVYLSRFYITMYYGLQVDENCSGQVLANIIFNSCNLLRVDLDGVMILVPQILTAVENILRDLEPKFMSHDQIPIVELRRASIHLLLSMLCLPLHFKALQIKNIFQEPNREEPYLTFISLKMRMIELLLTALTVETDSTNTQMLLGGLMLLVQDLSLCEEAEKTTLQNGDAEGPPSPTIHDSSPGSKPTNSTTGILRRPNTTGQGSPSPKRAAYSCTDIGLQMNSPLQDYDTAHGLFGHAASLVCNRLMASWKTDLNMALPAIEVLSGLAKVRLNSPNALMCKRTVNWICEFIVYQCSRPAPLHSKDLHSMIVAAFHCLTLWLVEHDYLMQDKECLHCVLEVVELGISGAKSQNRASDVPRLKGEKELKPVSQRVKEAAEGLLTCIMDHVGSFPPPCGPESVNSLLDEEALMKYCKDGGSLEHGMSFRYFVLDGSTVVGLLEQPLGNDQDPLPTVTALIRGPFGRQSWTMQLRHVPRNQKVSSKAQLMAPSRPLPLDNVGKPSHVTHRCFPEIVDQIPKVEADKSIPNLENIMSDQGLELEKMEKFIKEQVAFENKVKERVKREKEKAPYPDPATECKQPNVCHEYQTARLFLSHYGFLTLEALKESPNVSVPSLVMLDTTKKKDKLTVEYLAEDLKHLDSMPCRTCDTVFIFYVKSGQKMPFEILNNVTSKLNVQPTFLEFIRSLGWPVDVKKHAGWTGHKNTSWKILSTEEGDDFYPGDTGGSLYDGRKQVLYWADVCSEIAFVVPSPETYQPNLHRSSIDGSDDKGNVPGTPEQIRASKMAEMANKPKSLSLDLEKPPDKPRASDSPMTPTVEMRSHRTGRGSTAGSIADTKIFTVWLESYEDHENFPSGDFIQSCLTGLESTGTSSNSTVRSMVYIIFIHAMENGLFRIRMQGHTGRIGMAGPLIDGMVVSRRTLGSLVKQTALNICKRKRLESDVYQPPHVKRRLKIKEIVDKYQNKMGEPEFYTALFQDVTK